MLSFTRQLTPARRPCRSPEAPFASLRGFCSLSRSRFLSMLAPVAILALINGCTKQTGGVIDPAGTPPFIGAARVYPDTIKMTSLPQSAGILTVTIRAQATLVRQVGSADIAGVDVGVIASGSTSPFLTVALHDDGSSPDSLAGDGVYSTLLQFTIPKSASGVYILRFMASDIDGFVSNSVEAPLFMLRNNQPPVVSTLQAPDSAMVPQGGQTLISLYIRATDPDGQADITSVFFRSLDSSDPTQKFIMNNDGTAPGSVPGDSTYALIVKVVDGPTVRKTYRFAFQAVDTFGDTSATILHSIKIY